MFVHLLEYKKQLTNWYQNQWFFEGWARFIYKNNIYKQKIIQQKKVYRALLFFKVVMNH